METLKIDKWTIVRLIAFVIVIARRVAEHFGYVIPAIDDSAIISFVEMVIEIGIIVCGFWYNNSFSQTALKADEFLHALRGE